MGVFLVLHNHVFFFMSCSQSQKWQIQVGFEIHDWLSSSILKSLATIFSKEFCQRILFWERIIRGLIWLWQIAKTPSILMLFRASYNSHLIKKSKVKFAQRNSLWKFSQKFTHFFCHAHILLRQLSFFFVYWTWLNGLKKKLRFFRAGITALVAKAFWQWISKIHYFKGRTKPKIKGIILFLCKVEGGVEGEDLYCNFSNFENLIEDSFDFFKGFFMKDYSLGLLTRTDFLV